MEGERRKRKLESEEESEEQKMEKFFALIRSTKDVRDRLSKLKEDEKVQVQDKAKGVWNPTFQPEDFIDYDQELARTHFSTTPPAGTSDKQVAEKQPQATVGAAPPAAAAENNDKDKGSENLDLTLSL